jgi:dTDP-4-dehydrorhamnose 3,5-epimerase
MRFIAVPVTGAFVIEPERHEDERGFFARSWCREEFLEHGLNPTLEQCNISFNRKKGTLRGMHYQASPHEEAKLVRCTTGSIYDVLIDLRSLSPTFKRHWGTVLGAEDRRMLYIPEGCAHGFLTLEDATEVFYQMTARYHADSARGIRWNDPVFGIEWPGEINVMSDRDRAFPDVAFPVEVRDA